MTQFTRSLKIEWWESGVDFLAVTPFYVVSNLYKRKEGTIIAPMPEKLIEGTLAQLGKRYIWEGHGYWFHGFLGNFAEIYPYTVERNLKMMKVSISISLHHYCAYLTLLCYRIIENVMKKDRLQSLRNNKCLIAFLFL